MVSVYGGRRAVTVELDLQFHLLTWYRVTTHGAGGVAAGSTESAVRLFRRERAAPDCCASLVSEE